MADVGQLSLRHPYSETPGAKDVCTWAACFGLGALVGLFCINPDAGTLLFLVLSFLFPLPRRPLLQRCWEDAGYWRNTQLLQAPGAAAHSHPTSHPLLSTPPAGDYGVWEAECRRLVDRWAPGFAQAGCMLSLQRTRDYWLQVRKAERKR